MINFLTPLYLIGLAALAGPLILHLIRRQPREDQVFSSLMFLTPSPRRVSKKSRIDNWLLLLLRAAVLALVAFAFARPFLPAASDITFATPDRFRIVMIDQSGSMQRDNLWLDAIAAAENSVNDLAASDTICLATFDRQAHALVQPDLQADDRDEGSFVRENETKSAALEELARLKTAKPTWLATDLVAAVQFAMDQFESLQASGRWSPNAIAEVVLISDLQSGSDLQRLQNVQWPKGLSMNLVPVRSNSVENATATLLGVLEPNDAPEPDSAATQAPNRDRFRVRIDNERSSKQSSFQLTWVDENQSRSEPVAGQFAVQPGQSRVVQIDGPSFETGNLLLVNDEVAFDNRCYFHRDLPKKPRIVYLTNRPPITEQNRQASDIGYFLAKFASAEQRDAPELTVATPDQLQATLEQTNPISLVVANVDLTADTVAVLKPHIAAGGSLLLVLDGLPKQTAELETWWRAMFDDSKLTVREKKVDDFLLLQNIDFNSRLFGAFNNPKSNNFSKIHFWKAREIEIDDWSNWQRLANFENEQPAIIRRNVGSGEVFVLASGWMTDDSQLALSTKFVPLLINMFSKASTGAASQDWTIGDTIDGAIFETSTQVIDPDGKSIDRADNASFTPSQPGVYRWQVGEKTVFAVANLARNECQIEPWTTDQFERFGVGLKEQQTAESLQVSARQMQDRELENSQQWWRWMLLVGLSAIVLETFFSTRRVRVATEPV